MQAPAPTSHDADDRFKLAAGHWYGWQMLPGYLDGYQPYYSPILMEQVERKKSGRNLLRVRFFNAFYASGVQDFELVLRVIARKRQYLVAEIDESSSAGRVVVLSDLSANWLQQHCPGVLSSNRASLTRAPDGSTLDDLLNLHFFQTLRPFAPHS